MPERTCPVLSLCDAHNGDDDEDDDEDDERGARDGDCARKRGEDASRNRRGARG